MIHAWHHNKTFPESSSAWRKNYFNTYILCKATTVEKSQGLCCWSKPFCYTKKSHTPTKRNISHQRFSQLGCAQCAQCAPNQLRPSNHSHLEGSDGTIELNPMPRHTWMGLDGNSFRECLWGGSKKKQRWYLYGSSIQKESKITRLG